MPSEMTTAPEAPPPAPFSDTDILLNPEACNHLLKMADVYSKTDVVPAAFRGKPNDIFVAAIMARRLRVDLFMLLQNCYVIQGKVAFETKFAIALLGNSGKVRGPITYDMPYVDGKPSCTASVIDAATGETISHTLLWKTVEAEGWTKRNGSKWVSDPRLMLAYRSAIRLIRTHYPDVLLGAYTDQEVEEMNTVTVTPRARRANTVPDSMLGDITSSVQTPKRLAKPKKKVVEAPAPPMETVPADAEMGNGVPTDEEFRAMLGLLQAGLAECKDEEEVSGIEHSYIQRCANADGEMIEHRLNRVISLCDERREVIA